VRRVRWAVVDFDGEPASRVAVPGSPLRDGGSRGSAIGGEIITLGDQAPGLTDEQLRFRLLTLAGHTAPKSPASRREHAAGRNQLPTIAWASQQLPLGTRRTLHSKIIPANQAPSRQTRRPPTDLFSGVLVRIGMEAR
jgi:hypothetical protein